MKEFEGKAVLATGAGHGVGKQIAIQFAEQGANAVIVSYNAGFSIKIAEEIIRDYVKSLLVQADVSEPEDMDHVRERVLEGFRRIDTLALSAGMTFEEKVDEFAFEEWNRIISINLNGLFSTVKVFCSDFLINHGSIVYVSSDSASNGTGGAVAYPASRAGGEGLMRRLIKELGPKGVSVNIIASRLIDTGDMVHVNYPTRAELDAVLEKVPVHRYGTVRGVANLAVFLADKDNSYIQEQTILLNGGRTIA